MKVIFENRKMLRVALIEDSPADTQLIHQILSECGLLNVYDFASLGAVKKTQYDFELIFCDLSLPDSWGRDTVKQIREIYPDAHLIVLTGLCGTYLTGHITKKILSWGANEVISKHTLSADLIEFILKKDTP